LPTERSISAANITSGRSPDNELCVGANCNEFFARAQTFREALPARSIRAQPFLRFETINPVFQPANGGFENS
jgi:hypothetical protein